MDDKRNILNFEPRLTIEEHLAVRKWLKKYVTTGYNEPDGAKLDRLLATGVVDVVKVLAIITESGTKEVVEDASQEPV